MTRAVLLDTVGLLALWDRRDPWRPRALPAFEALAAGGATFCTTTLVLHECGNAAARTPGAT